MVSQQTKEVTKIEYRDTLVSFKVAIPPAKFKFEGKVNLPPCNLEPIVIHDENEKVKYKIIIDSTGYKTDIECKADSLLVQAKLQIKEITTLKETVKEYEKREGFFQKVIRYLIGFVSLVVIIAVILLILYRKIRKKLPIP